MVFPAERAAVSLLVFSTALAGCDDALTPPRIEQRLQEDAGPGAGHAGPHVVPPTECAVACCPTDPSCYGPFQNPSVGSGAECLAQRDNTGQTKWQFRQTFSVSKKPRGIADPTIAGLLLPRTRLNRPECNESGSSGLIQLVELDIVTREARVGFAGYAPDFATALRDGLCFVEDVYEDTEWGIPQADLYQPEDWPEGLRHPMALPFQVAPVQAAALDEDFDLDEKRAELLARLAPDGDLGARGKTGVFYFDEASGYMHGYSPLVYIVNFEVLGTLNGYNAVPVREAEIRSQINDPAHPNCTGSYMPDTEDLSACNGTATTPAWGCAPGSCLPGEEAANSIHGYFLLAELEQLYNTSVSQTLCAFFATAYEGWTLTGSCRSDSKWNPRDPRSGLPPGDWCAKTNRPATPDCHDALRSVSISASQAFPIRAETCRAL